MCEGVKTNYIKIKLICFGPYSIILSCYYLKHSISNHYNCRLVFMKFSFCASPTKSSI